MLNEWNIKIILQQYTKTDMKHIQVEEWQTFLVSTWPLFDTK